MAARLSAVILLGIYAVLWAGGVTAHLLWQATPDGAGWSAAAFLTCGAALLLLRLPGARLWLLAVGAAGFLAELAGARLGAPFGQYSYTPVLEPQLGGVPVVMSCAWMILIAYVKSLIEPLPLTRLAAVAAGAAWMTMIDLAIDPVATVALDYWRWHTPGYYYGIPWSNFAGWVAVSAVLLASGISLRIESRWPGWIGLSVVVFFGLLAIAHRLPAAAGVALALACWHLWLVFGITRKTMRSPRSFRDV
jgi:putative membrane protein